MASVASKPWLKQYDLGGQGITVLPSTLKPYPKEPLFSILDNSAKDYPNNPSVHFMDKVITFAELKKMVDKFAHALADLGVKPGDRVATHLLNSPQFIISDFGILKTGATHVPCSTLHKEYELMREIEGSGAETLICMDSSMEIVDKVKKNAKIKRIIVTSVDDLLKENPEPKRIPGTYHFLDLL
ncbi:MAG: AMP-binding protein, partial [Chloroflexi bacterium]|nr:AMP-binding protein [Chloroflexota bacterium]